jgi:serine/threonine protein kinase
MTLAAGTKLGPYEIAAPLGAGGMGEVYRAKDPRLGREVAIKVLPASFAQDADRLRRFEQEARSASALNHPNIVMIHEIGTANGSSYIAMELVEGGAARLWQGSCRRKPWTRPYRSPKDSKAHSAASSTDLKPRT